MVLMRRELTTRSFLRKKSKTCNDPKLIARRITFLRRIHLVSSTEPFDAGDLTGR